LDRDDAASLAVLRKGQGNCSTMQHPDFMPKETASFRKQKWTPVWQEQPKGWHRKQYWFIAVAPMSQQVQCAGLPM